MGVLDKIFGSKNQKILKKVQPLVRAINGLEEDYSRLQDEDLKNKRNGFIKRHSEGESLDELLPEAFAVVREVSKRQLGLRHYDCQLVGGVALHNCQIAEMATGEGKTLVATLPSYLNSITERKVVLVTVNDYLAKRDAEWMQPIYENLGIEVSFITSGQDLNERKEAYKADIIYATNNELGFDFLRNNMVVNTEDRVMNDYYFAIIDEVDSILIDEARTPLVISGPTENTADTYQKISKFIPKLNEQVSEENEEGESRTVKEGHFIIEEKSKQIELTDSGHDYIEQLLKDSNMLQQDQSLYSSGNLRMLHFIQSSLRAHFLFKKDVDYMVQENQVVLIDENTGRAMPGRRLADGLHQAIEQKENVPIQMESQTLASCTFQNYFRQFEKLSGMTGTASTEAEEFAELAKELEEEIQQLFEESGLDEEDYEDFKQGLLDELFGEDSDFSEELTEREKRIKEKIKRRDSLMQGRGLIRCVNWETGAIKAFPENETIGDTWIQITQFFSPFETKNGKQIVVDRTIAGAVEMAKGLGIKVLHSNKKEAKFESDKADFVDALKKMRMFQVRSTGNLAVKDGTTEIKY